MSTFNLWEMSGPEEGDKIDHTVLVCHTGEDLDRYEILRINAGNLRKRKSLGRRIAALLNEAEASLE